MMPLERVLQLLICPSCGNDLANARSDELLNCACGLVYPIVGDIPRIFIGEMRSTYETDFPEIVRRYPQLRECKSESRETRSKLSTRESFGYEWTVYHQMLAEWSENAKFYFELVGLESISGKLVLDAGCGKGRHAYYASRAGAEVVAMDFSRAIDVAKRNAGDSGSIAFVQADITSPPFRRETFDLVYSFGVLHHLSNPEGGFRQCVSLVRPGGRVAFYVYHWPEGQPVKQVLLKGVTLARKVTTRIPFPALRAISWLAGIGLYGGIVMPYKVLSRVKLTRPLAARMPLRAYAQYPVSVIINDQFDRFSAPIENRYTSNEVRAWLEHACLDDIQILPEYGWRAIGRVRSRPMAARRHEHARGAHS